VQDRSFTERTASWLWFAFGFVSIFSGHGFAKAVRARAVSSSVRSSGHARIQELSPHGGLVPDLPCFDDQSVDEAEHDHFVDLNAATRGRQVDKRPLLGAGPRHPGAVRPDMVRTASGLIDNMQAKHEIDLVDDFAYPLPVTVICQQLGVPHEDEPRFHPWAEAIITQLDPRPGQESAAAQASAEMNQYMAELVERYRSEPGPGLLSGLAAEEGMSTQDVVATGRLLLIAGHETTVNLITNGMLTLLRHPEILERLRNEEQLAIPLVEELLRYEPPVQINPNTWPWTTSRLGRSQSRRAHASSSRWPPATETRTGFPILTVSTRSGTTTSIWVFSPASTTASAPGSRVRRRRPR